ncbi:nitroreductase family protein [Enterococcus alishanensis]|uniref:Nitroreductase family protein n=1 Tax=Enterococcus alishanensis TaxID=1303817 RepID=A0ABS6TBK4_9ENTE|nr:nitroreductase family protein [Enterococcus alishanensis]MBV7390289.1 nitroreductase family protein [Enterococcus alishanensis]
MNNQMLDLLQTRRTYRDFDENYQLSEEELQVILSAARQAPTWMNGQFYSIFVVKDSSIREKLVAMNPGNPHMLKSSVFLIFVADLNRSKKVADKYEVDFPIIEGIDPLLTAVTDTALAMNSATLAAESLGLGSVIVGSIRKDIDAISQLLNLPDYMFPVAGMSIGKPTVEMKVKPRLPEEAIVFYDTFKDYDYQVIEKYDETMDKFAEARETKIWSQKFADYFSQKPNTAVDQFLKDKKIQK